MPPKTRHQKRGLSIPLDSVPGRSNRALEIKPTWMTMEQVTWHTSWGCTVPVPQALEARFSAELIPLFSK